MIDLTEEQINALNKFYNKYSNDIVSIYRIGSSVVPFINNVNDIDILIIVKDNSKYIFRDKSRIDRSILFHDYGLGTMITEERFMKTNIDWDNNYICRYIGKEFKPKDLLENIDECKNYLSMMINDLIRCKDLYEHKVFYRLYVISKYIENKSYDLSATHIKNINILHDKKEEDIDKRKKLINSLINKYK